MSRISQLYKETIEKIYIEVVLSSFNISQFNLYCEMMNNLQSSISECVHKAIITYFKKLDNNFCISINRKKIIIQEHIQEL